MTMNRKGFLLASETLKIVIAVISITFLIYFLTSIYFSKVNDEKKVQAEDLVETISSGISLDSDSVVVDVINPRGWNIFSFTNSDVRPNSCAGRNCLCVCDDALDLNERFNRQQKKCDGKGICLAEENLVGFETIEITGDLKVVRIIKSEEGVSFVEQ